MAARARGNVREVERALPERQPVRAARRVPVALADAVAEAGVRAREPDGRHRERDEQRDETGREAPQHGTDQQAEHDDAEA